MEWIPTIHNKKPEWCFLKDRSIRGRDPKQYPFCYFLLFRKQNKQKSGNILKPLENFRTTKSFIYVFELYNIIHKVSLLCISFLQKWKPSRKPPNSCFQLALNTFVENSFSTYFNNFKFLFCEKWLALWPFISFYQEANPRWLSTHKTIFVP